MEEKNAGRKTRDVRNGIGFCVVLTVIIWARFSVLMLMCICICYTLMSLMNSYHLIASIRCLYLILSHSLSSSRSKVSFFSPAVLPSIQFIRKAFAFISYLFVSQIDVKLIVYCCRSRHSLCVYFWSWTNTKAHIIWIAFYVRIKNPISDFIYS